MLSRKIRTPGEPTQAVSSEEKVTYSGSPWQAYIANSFVAYTGNAIGIFSPLLPQTKLNQTLAGVLGTSTVVSTCIAQIPMAYVISTSGGKKAVLISMTSLLTGMLSLTILSSVTDIRTIDGLDWRYATLLASGYLIGFGSGVYQLVNNSIKWAAEKEQIPIIQSVYGSIVSSANITTPIVINALSHHYGYPVPFALYASLIAAGGVVAIKFIQPDPYNQFKRKLPLDLAKQRAEEAGQLPTMIQDEVGIATFVKDHIHFAVDRRGLILYMASFITLGSYIVTGTIFPTLLKSGYNIDSTTAVYISSIATLITLLSRPVAGTIISKWDHDSGGMKVFMTGCALTIGGAIPLALSNVSQEVVYAGTASINLGLAFSMVSLFNIGINWSTPKNENLKPYAPHIAIGGLGTSGTLGGFILPLALGLLVNSQGEAGYQQYFFIVIAMMLTAALAVPIVDCTVRHAKEEYQRFFNKSMTLFGGKRNPNNAQENSVEIEVEQVPLNSPAPGR